MMKSSVVGILRRGSSTSVCSVCVIPAASKRNFCFLEGGWGVELLSGELYEHNVKKGKGDSRLKAGWPS